MEFLPSDLWQEICCRLPCKDILNCKCVCRAWYNLLSHPNFTITYTINSPFTSLFLVHRSQNTNYVFLLEIASNTGGVITTPLKPKIPQFEKVHLKPNIIGSCNGLLFSWINDKSSHCNGVVEKVHCFNPLFGGCVEIAEHESQCKSNSLLSVEYMIGYISSTNSFKLLRIVFHGFEQAKQAYVFAVGIDRKWRRVKDHLNMYYQPSGVSFKGLYHWIFKHENVRYLNTFDFDKEKSGRKSKLPHLLQEKWRLNLVALNNHISVIDDSCCSQIDVWTMEEYGVAESWSRKMIIRDWHRPQVGDLCVVAALPNGDILFSDRFKGNIMCLNPEGKPAKIKVGDYESFSVVSTLYAAEFAPRFYSLDEDVRGRQCWITPRVWCSVLCFSRNVLERFLCVKDDRFMED